MTLYKVMPIDDRGELISGADSRQTFGRPAVGMIITMPGNGVYCAPGKAYVLHYYSGLADHEVLLELEAVGELLTGNPTDREPELSYRSVRVVGFETITS